MNHTTNNPQPKNILVRHISLFGKKKILFLSCTCIGILVFYFTPSKYFNQSFAKKVMPKISFYKIDSRTQHFDNIDSRTQEDPELISHIRYNFIVKPNGKPYHLSRPKSSYFTEFKQQWEYLKEHYKNKTNGTFIEVGGYDGETLSNTLNLELEYRWTGLLIEPNPISFKMLIEKNRKVNAVQCCLSDSHSPKMVDFKIATYLSKVIPKKSVREQTVSVRCHPLYSLMASVNLKKIDLLTIDMEGFEMKVLQTLPWDKVDISAILVEYFHVPEGKASVKKFFEEKKYKLVKEFPMDYFYVKSN